MLILCFSILGKYRTVVAGSAVLWSVVAGWCKTVVAGSVVFVAWQYSGLTCELKETVLPIKACESKETVLPIEAGGSKGDCIAHRSLWIEGRILPNRNMLAGSKLVQSKAGLQATNLSNRNRLAGSKLCPIESRLTGSTCPIESRHTGGKMSRFERGQESVEGY